MVPTITIGFDDRTHAVLTALVSALTGMNTNGNPASVLMSAAAERSQESMPSASEEDVAKGAKKTGTAALETPAQAPEPNPNPAAAPVASNVTLADVRTAITYAIKKNAGNKAQVVELLQRYGAQNASTLPEEHWAEFITKVNAL